MQAIELVDRAIKVLSEDEEVQQRYRSDIQWLEIRKQHWQKDKLRIGVVGVTSSGKSTLINAILGSKLLSVAVKPSSSQLVSCSYCDEPSATVFFKDGRKLVLAREKLTPEVVKRYSDEECNTNNRENVMQLELSTPSFDLGKDILLIDSPGLDAYKLETHEKLTLETLIPTIDICIFVTTFKTNSDAKMLSFLNTVAKYNCPVLIIQNMLDSVKPSLDGEKSVARVVEEHKNRVIRIINKSDIVNKESVRIEQISAVQAMKTRCIGNVKLSEVDQISIKRSFEKSNYEKFVRAVNDIVKSQRPGIEKQRLRNVFDKLVNLAGREKAIIDGVEKTLVLPFQFEGLKAQVQEKTVGIKRMLERLVEVLSCNNGKDIYGFSEENIRSMINIVKKCESDICSVITDYNQYLFTVIDRIGLSRRDIVNFNGLPNVPEVKLQTVTKTRTIREKKSGVGNWLKRGWGWLTNDGDLGYDVYTETYTEVDDIATKKALEQYIMRVSKQYDTTISQWYNKTQITVQNICNAIELEMNSYLEKQQQVVEARKVKDIIKKIQSLADTLNGIHKDSGTTSNTKKSESDGVSNNAGLKNINVSEAVLNIALLADRFISSINRNTLKFTLNHYKAESRKSVILGWDKNSCDTFVNRFFGLPADKQGVGNHKTYEGGGDPVVLLDPAPQSIMNSFSDSKGKNVFIMTNTIQYGAAINQINQSGIVNALDKNDLVLFVVQDFNEILNGDAIGEGLKNMLHARQELGIGNACAVLINHENPIYNLAFIQNQIAPCRNISEETELQAELQERFPAIINSDTKKHIAEILRIKET